MRLYHQVSLAAPPEVRTSGAFINDEPFLEWVQPYNTFQAQYHSHPGTLVVNGRTAEFGSGSFLVLPPASRCQIIRGDEDEQACLYFSFIPQKSEDDLMALPLVSSMGEVGEHWALAYRKALNNLIVLRTPVRSVAWAWLWAVAEPLATATENPFVSAAERIFEDRLSQSITIAEVAEEIHISRSQLTRLFLAERGCTPLQNLLEMRAAKAYHLLTRTTMPIKSVAAACGIPDAHAFNRFVRSRLGGSPRAIRLGKTTVDSFRVASLRSFPEERVH